MRSWHRRLGEAPLAPRSTARVVGAQGVTRVCSATLATYSIAWAVQILLMKVGGSGDSVYTELIKQQQNLGEDGVQ
jgi:hypothetical protein